MNWHAVWIDSVADGRFEVLCIPHGHVSTHGTWFDAVIGQYAHDGAFKGPDAMWETNSPQAKAS